MAKPCPRCCGPFRETVNGVCQVCGADYRPDRSEALIRFDTMPAAKAVAKAWSDFGRFPAVHARKKDEVRKDMPLLARALDRLTQ